MNYPRSVVVLDGFEFLYAIHGKDRALDFLRRLVDIATTSDDLAMIPINLDAFDSRSRALIKRELDLLNNEDIEDWLLSPEDLEGHLFHLPDQQEILWDEELKTKKAPIKKDDVIGKFRVVYDEELVGEYDLLAVNNVEKVNIFTRLIKSLNYLIWGDV